MRQSIETRLLQRANQFRLRAEAAAGSKIAEYNDDLSEYENHLMVATMLADHFGWPYSEIIGGSNSDENGYNFILIEGVESCPLH
tara:strand:- start:127 stop:381 length:255 start_codon:yes stop_codon:yes gene_type:complete